MRRNKRPHRIPSGMDLESFLKNKNTCAALHRDNASGCQRRLDAPPVSSSLEAAPRIQGRAGVVVSIIQILLPRGSCFPSSWPWFDRRTPLDRGREANAGPLPKITGSSPCFAGWLFVKRSSQPCFNSAAAGGSTATQRSDWALRSGAGRREGGSPHACCGIDRPRAPQPAFG